VRLFQRRAERPAVDIGGQKRLDRTKHNALGARVFWLDIDCGATKPYRDQQSAGDALAAFCRTLQLPTPLVVMSGAGLSDLEPRAWSARFAAREVPTSGRIFTGTRSPVAAMGYR